MTSNFLKLIIQRYPNSYELGEAIRKFYFLCEDNKTLDITEIERLFINKHI